jgi:hypothetical protein
MLLLLLGVDVMITIFRIFSQLFAKKTGIFGITLEWKILVHLMAVGRWYIL